jgi:PPOX class probable F420-dependent enzyme
MLDLSNKRDAHIAERLRSDVAAWLVTVRPDGRPHVVAVWYLWDEADNSILIFSKPAQQKLKNIRANPEVALALEDSDEGDDPVIVEGRAKLTDDPDVSATLAAYVEKYGERMKGINLYPPEQMAAVYSQGIRITPTKIRQW